jgi:UrcA family protein
MHVDNDDQHRPTRNDQERLMITTSSKQTTPRPLAVAVALAALTVTTLSVAAPASDATDSVKVRYSDLNLATDAGVGTLYRRIANAARLVCPDPYSRDLSVVAASEHCQADAIAKAVAEVNNPRLALMHAARASHG